MFRQHKNRSKIHPDGNLPKCESLFRAWQLVLILLLAPGIFAQVPERIYQSKSREASRLFDMAQAKVSKEQYQEALVLLDRALQYDTDHIEAYFTRAGVKEKINDAEGAFTDYQIVLLLDSTFREAAFNRAKLRYRQEQYERAIIDFKKVLTMGSSGTQAIYFKGTPVNQEGPLTVSQITTSHHLEADIYNFLGLCYQALNQHDDAVEAWNMAISINPRDANYYVNRGLSYSAFNANQKAMADFKMALAIEPDHAIARFNLTNLLETSGGLGIATYDQLIENNPGFTSAYVNRAIAKLNEGDLQGAIEDYDMAITIDPHEIELYINRALALEKKGAWRDALADYNQALSLEPNSAKALRSRGRVLYKLERYELALKDLNQAMQLDQDHGGSYFNRALIHRKMGNNRNSCDDLNKAVNLGVPAANEAIRSYCSS